MAGTGGELAVAEATQLAPHRVHADREAEFLPQPVRQIGQPPAHHAVHGRIGTALNHGDECLALRLAEPP